MSEPDHRVLQLLRDIRSDVGRMDKKISDLAADLRSDIQSLRADLASDLLMVEKRIGESVVGLRRSVMEYHSSAIGHGVLISELEERLRRIEQHVGLPPPAY